MMDCKGDVPWFDHDFVQTQTGHFVNQNPAKIFQASAGPELQVVLSVRYLSRQQKLTVTHARTHTPQHASFDLWPPPWTHDVRRSRQGHFLSKHVSPPQLLLPWWQEDETANGSWTDARYQAKKSSNRNELFPYNCKLDYCFFLIHIFHSVIFKKYFQCWERVLLFALYSPFLSNFPERHEK